MATYRVETESGTYDVEVADGNATQQSESLPQTDITMGGVAKSFMDGVNDPKVMGGGVVGGATKALGDMYSTNKENLLNLIQDKGALPTSDLGKPFGIDMTKTPVARTSASLLVDLLGGVAGGALAENSPNMAKGLLNKFKGVSKPNPEEISSWINTALTESKGLESVIKRTADSDVASIGAKYNLKKQDIGNKIKTLSDVDIKKAADEAVLANRGDRFFNWARDISKRFGTDYEKAIAGEKISTAELHSSLGNVLKERGLLDGSGQILKPQSAWSQSEGKIYDYYNKVGSKVPGTTTTPEVTFGAFGPESKVVKTGQDRLDLSQVDKDLKSIFASKDGTPYQSGDHILTQVRRAVTDNFPGSGKIKIVRAKFAPELQAKNEAIKVLDPFNKSGSFDTTGGSNFFSRYANGKANPDEVRWIEAMRKVNAKEGNIFQGLDDLASQKRNLVKEASNLPKLQEAEVKGTILGHQESLAQNQMDTENHISLLDAMMKGAEKDKAMADFGKLLLKAGAVGAVGAGTAKIVGAGAKSVTGILE